MGSGKITLGEVQKASLKESDCVIMRSYRVISTRVTMLLYNTRLLPWHVTLVSFIVALAGAGFFLFGQHFYLVVGVVLLQVSFILDCVDGEIARLKGTGSPFGAWFDPMVDYFSIAAFIGAAALGQFFLFDEPFFLILGLFALMNFGMVSLMIPTRAKYVDRRALKPVAVAGSKRYVGHRGLAVTLISFAGLFNQVFFALAVFATVWVGLWVKMTLDFYKLVKKIDAGKLSS